MLQTDSWYHCTTAHIKSSNHTLNLHRSTSNSSSDLRRLSSPIQPSVSSESQLQAVIIQAQHGPRRKRSLHRCVTPLVEVPRDRYLGSPLARWLLPSTDYIENTFTVLLTVCVGLFTELLPGNALIKSLTGSYVSRYVKPKGKSLCLFIKGSRCR
jgi:hypothetical protein